MDKGVVYVLRLSEGKYYVGHTRKQDIMDRIDQHTCKLDNAAEWTRLYDVLDVIELQLNADQEDEKRKTLQYMREYGWENVRGSCYCAINMKEAPPELAVPTIQPALKLEHAKVMKVHNCNNCNQPGHFAKQCPSIHCRLCTEKGHYAKDCPKKALLICYQCGETGHLKAQCPTKEARCFNCKQPGHYANACPANNKRKTEIYLSKTYGACRKCGQTGHWARSCTS